MWRLATNQLSDMCVYRGKKIYFVDSIKAQVRNIYVRGQKVQSAYFSPRTKPIFRSESARYAIFIQMSREMWHFDAESSGEVVLNKLINGFLPELFKRWRKINAHHLVNIVLFTRVVYEQGGARIPTEKEDLGLEGRSYKDFFRVVVSNMASTDWAVILHQLKKEFSVFLRDVLIQPVHHSPPDTPRIAPYSLPTQMSPTNISDTSQPPEKMQWKPRPTHIIAGRPSDAIHGNILEAINLATSQFSRDFMDRDLARTGVSVVIITPGTGHFEVDYENLRMTTENLLSNGIGIDLVCLAKMPLHSVPLFKYQSPLVFPLCPIGPSDKPGAEESILNLPQSAGPYGNSLPGKPGMSPPKTVTPVEGGEWVYAIPHWIDISFWSSSQQTKSSSRQSRRSENGARKRQFVARCKMYELQMMGIMENEISSISIPFLHESPFYEPYKPVARSRLQQAAMAHNHNYATSIREKERRDEAKQFEWMDDYDNMVFRPITEVKEGIAKIKKRRKEKDRQWESMALEGNSSLGPPFVLDRARDKYSPGTPTAVIAEKQISERRIPQRDLQAPPPFPQPDRSEATTLVSSSGSTLGSSLSALRSGRLARHISFGFKGFGGGGTPKAIASTGLSTTNVPGPTLIRGFIPEAESAVSSKEAPKTPVQPVTPNASTLNISKITTSAESSDSSSAPNPKRSWSSDVVPAKNPVNPAPNAVTALERTQERRKMSLVPPPIDTHKDRTQIDILKAVSMSRLSGPRLEMNAPSSSVPASLSPTSALAPWFSLLNPCNPKKNSTNLVNVYRRWQHVFPRPLRTASVKWKSLCSPAALPLTTEHFPTAEQLRTEYQENPYVISQNEDDDDLVRNREELVREMISQRLEQGFQIVVGSAVAEATSNHGGDNNIFEKNYMTKAGSSVFMSMGSQIHQLICDVEYNVEVKRYVRKPTVSVPGVGDNATFAKYTPYIKTVLCTEYLPKVVDFRGGNHEYNWNYVDQSIGGYESNFTEQLRFCRSRFLLIPSDPPQSAKRSNNTSPLGYSEDSDEEIRIEGIKKLTQLFQKYRHIPPEERNFDKIPKKKDQNPLEILYKTFDPSVVVAQQLESLPLTTEIDVSARRAQLFVGTEMFDRSNLNLRTLAQEIQGPKGVRHLNRMWHIRLHQKCFIGSELVTWMTENFRDLESRLEAVELGNELMKSGLFHHVEARHPFRDGNYFYQISNEYAINRPSSKGGWFGNRSKPIDRFTIVAAATHSPAAASDPVSPNYNRSRSSTVVDELESNRDLPGLKSRIQLSKAMKYDVDPKKQSYRPEIITLHYDRLHNPDNCYHIRIDWMNVTSKLIKDAICNWAHVVERFGLSLVEAPIEEISLIPIRNPLRAPAVVMPCLDPPKFPLGGLISPAAVDMSASFSAAVSKPDPIYYHKAILRKHGFVLDTEAAKNSPPDVEVVYSWGKPNYRYSQYIHRSGVVFAQITDEGEFLLMANRLYTQRSGGQNKYDKQTSDPYDSSRHNPAPGASGFSNVSYDIGSSVASTLATTGHLPSPPPSFTMPAIALSGGGGSYISPEVVKEELERFCQDEDGLRAFYDEIDRRAVDLDVSVPGTAAAVNTVVGDTGVAGLTPHSPSICSVPGKGAGEGGVTNAAQVTTGPPPQLSKMFGTVSEDPYWLEKGGDRSIPHTPLLSPLGGTTGLCGGATAAASQGALAGSGRNSSRSGRSSIVVEPVVELGEGI